MPEPPSEGPLFCEFCRRKFSLQLIYSPRQAAHILNVSLSTLRFYMTDHRLKFRYRLLRGGQRVYRVVDLNQLWEFIEEYLPTPEALQSSHQTKTRWTIKRITDWHKLSGRKSGELSRQRKIARDAAKSKSGSDDT